MPSRLGTPLTVMVLVTLRVSLSNVTSVLPPTRPTNSAATDGAARALPATTARAATAARLRKLVMGNSFLVGLSPNGGGQQPSLQGGTRRSADRMRAAAAIYF